MSWQQSAALLLQLRLTASESNQAEAFTYAQNLVQRALAILASLVSITFCLVSIYLFLAIDPKRLVFRHQLIAFLLLFDLLKGCILLIFPARVFTHATSYYSNRFCQVIGFFTATAIEGADIAILSFAVHTFLLIFRPGLSVKVGNSSRVEGGLYKFRYYVYALSFVIPLVMASLAHIGTGYSSFVCWCYLPQRPVWYRLVLSWVPRYCIVVIILSVYGLIYWHVLREFRTLGGVFTTMHKQRQMHGLHPAVLAQKPSFFSSLIYFFSSLRESIFPRFILPDDDKFTPHTSSASSEIDPISDRPRNAPGEPQGGPLDTENIIGDADIQAANLETFRKRQKVIEKQMKSIFIYPFAYIFMWLFPFILQCTQMNYEQSHGPIVWLNYLGAFMQPFYGFVDSMVFFYREQPWKYTIMRNFERDHLGRLDSYIVRNPSAGDSESLNTSARYTKSSFAVSFQVDMNQYSKWRRLLNKLHFPLMKLPTEENIARFSLSYLNNRMENRPSQGTSFPKYDSPNLAEFNALQGKHDFSNLLSGGLTANEFRLTLDSYSLSFNQSSRRHLVTSGGRQPSVASISNKSNRSRRMSAMDTRAAIPECEPYVPAPNLLSRPSHKRASVQRSGNSVAEDTELDFLEFLRHGPT